MTATMPVMVIEINSETVLGAPSPSSSVIVLRDGPAGLEVLLLRRHSRSAVLGNAHVFPGGKLDAADEQALALACDQPIEQLPSTLNEPDLAPATALGLYVAALRETFEECDLLLGSPAQGEALQQALDRLHAAQPLLDTFEALGLPLPTRALHPWSRWITPKVPSVTNKRFDTRFFVAKAPVGQIAAHDNHEATETLWIRPAEALQRYWNHDMDLAPPQIMTLSQLARFEQADEALTSARQRAPALIEPEPFDQDGQRVICYPGDPRRSRSEPIWQGPTRLTYRNKRFEPEGGLAALLPAGA
ncbi:NUDIX hydrolase [Curvibacter lanceolatus]|uniref:NUDIX hydrolase n=1 Tax=Curvibacter lanceolatus TaxID=86182 RepID=UPI001FE16641|nr:NUDIX hydrolase [Curvibacter lanceolatus]